MKTNTQQKPTNQSTSPATKENLTRCNVQSWVRQWLGQTSCKGHCWISYRNLNITIVLNERKYKLTKKKKPNSLYSNNLSLSFWQSKYTYKYICVEKDLEGYSQSCYDGAIWVWKCDIFVFLLWLVFIS